MLARSGPCRTPRAMRAISAPLTLLLQVEHGRVFLAPQRVTERREFAPRRRGEGTMPPAAQCDGNDAAQAGMELQQRNESGFGDPVDRELRTVRPHVGDDGQRMDDVAEGRRAYDQDGAHVALAWVGPDTLTRVRDVSALQPGFRRNPVECAHVEPLPRSYRGTRRRAPRRRRAMKAARRHALQTVR